MMASSDQKSPNPAACARIKLPGFGLPYNSWGDDKSYNARRLSAVQWWTHAVMTVRERCMLNFINQITDKPEWSRKVRENDVVAKWKKEATELDWDQAGFQYGSMSKQMFEYCILELREKAMLYERTGLVPVLDVTSCVLKSDGAITPALKHELRQAISSLENVSEEEKDWHPGSDGRVLDLIHPSLFPLIYRRSRILPNSTIDTNNCLQSIGEGEIIPDPLNDSEALGDGPSPVKFELWSPHFQWLPCNVSFPDGESAEVESYINNLHPENHKNLYCVIERIITKVIPLWNVVYQCHESGQLGRKPRISCERIEYTYPEDVIEKRPHGNDKAMLADTERSKGGIEYEESIIAHRLYTRPEPQEYQASKITEADVKDKFAFIKNHEKRIQVIVKLANIHLTPDKPDYQGGSWHVEGQLNEHIVATALYYYDNDNITDSHLAFRTRVDSEDLEENLCYEQGDFIGIEQVFGIEDGDQNVQELGSVLTREDRLIAFPNGFQHRVGSFRLADPTKPGHRKILALFLVAPSLPIISTANVPPQQRHWWTNEADCLRENQIDEHVTDTETFPIGMEEAKSIREELMAERGRMDKDVEHEMASMPFTFCEH